MDEPKSLADLMAEAKKITDRKQYQELMAQIAEKEIELQLAENAQRLEKEAREQAEFEVALAKHLAQIEDLEIKKRFLNNNERSMIENMITGATLTKLQLETYNEALKLAKTINRDIEKFKSEVQTVPEIDLFGQDYTWQNVAKGLLQRVSELLMWNDNRPDHRRTVTPENVKVYPTKWGEPLPDDEPPGADDIPEVDQAIFDVRDLNL